MGSRGGVAAGGLFLKKGVVRQDRQISSGLSRGYFLLPWPKGWPATPYRVVRPPLSFFFFFFFFFKKKKKKKQGGLGHGVATKTSHSRTTPISLSSLLSPPFFFLRQLTLSLSHAVFALSRTRSCQENHEK
jgi:hypothetical protein